MKKPHDAEIRAMLESYEHRAIAGADHTVEVAFDPEADDEGRVAQVIETVFGAHPAFRTELISPFTVHVHVYTESADAAAAFVHEWFVAHEAPVSWPRVGPAYSA